MTATDDYSWDNAVDYPATVMRQPAGKALRTHNPEAVISSWTPPGNIFERQVFTTPSVQTYIAIGCQHESAAGDWVGYRAQTSFDFSEEPALSRLLLPPENHGAVYVFHRR